MPHSGDVPNTLMHTSATSVMFIPHNFADRDPSRETVQGVRLQLKGSKSGGFAGFPDPDSDPDDASRDPSKSWPGVAAAVDDLRSREKEEKRRESSEDEPGYKVHKGANYFGTPYTEGVFVPLEALEPDLGKQYKSEEIRVSDLGLNGSAAGLWIP